MSYDSSSGPPCYRVGPMPRSPFADLVHRVNNLLSTIEIQIEVAKAEGTLAAHARAFLVIGDSARRTHEEVRLLRRERALDHESGSGDAGGAGGGSSGSSAESF